LYGETIIIGLIMVCTYNYYSVEFLMSLFSLISTKLSTRYVFVKITFLTGKLYIIWKVGELPWFFQWGIFGEKDEEIFWQWAHWWKIWIWKMSRLFGKNGVFDKYACGKCNFVTTYLDITTLTEDNYIDCATHILPSADRTTWQ